MITAESTLKTKINTLDLGEKLTQTEFKNSLFEEQLRQAPVGVCSAFISSGKIQAAQFKPNSTQLPLKEPQVGQELSQLTVKNPNEVLEAAGPLQWVTGKRVAVLFSGGPASGGHNVIMGIQKALGEHNLLFGVRSGPKGLITGDLFEITPENLATVFNLGGFDFLGSDRTKIKTKEQYEQVKNTVLTFKLDGIVVVGGDDSNTNAAFLANFLLPFNCAVIGVPKTIDGDLQVGHLLPISFGFDTATKIYAELVGNILQDTPSSRKYWHFIKLMGRSASHVALEVALQTKPQITLISEEVAQKKQTLDEIITSITQVIVQRAIKNKPYGVVLIPEGVIEFIPEFQTLIKEINGVMSKFSEELDILSIEEKLVFIQKKLSQSLSQLLLSLPDSIRSQLLLERDSHGNLQVSQIPTEQLIIDMVKLKIKEMKSHADHYFGPGKIELTSKEFEKFLQFKFSSISHFFGYEGRCGAPTRFDAAYTFNLGLTAGSLILGEHTGYIAAVSELDKGGKPLALPLTSLMSCEKRGHESTLVIEKALVDIQSPSFVYFSRRRTAWALEDSFSNPGPIQQWGPAANQAPMIVALNHGFSTLNCEIGQAFEIK